MQLHLVGSICPYLIQSFSDWLFLTYQSVMQPDAVMLNSQLNWRAKLSHHGYSSCGAVRSLQTSMRPCRTKQHHIKKTQTVCPSLSDDVFGTTSTEKTKSASFAIECEKCLEQRSNRRKSHYRASSQAWHSLLRSVQPRRTLGTYIVRANEISGHFEVYVEDGYLARVWG